MTAIRPTRLASSPNAPPSILIMRSALSRDEPASSVRSILHDILHAEDYRVLHAGSAHTVNLTSRIEGQAQADEILISSAVRDYLTDDAWARHRFIA